MKRLILATVLCFCISPTQAATKAEDAVRLSKLTISAMECANFTKDGVEAQRLADIGIAAGKQFLALIPTMSDDERKAASPNIALLWRALWGPSIDFELGQVWKEIETGAYQSLGEDTKQWDNNKLLKYSQKNCALIR
jgi:hypothetical protein